MDLLMALLMNENFRTTEQSLRTEPVTGPAAWTGASMRARQDWVHSLSEREITDLETATAKVSGQRVESITQREFPLPILGDRLAAVRSDPQAALRFVSKRLCACADFRRKLLLTARVILLSARVPGSVAAHIESYRTGDLNLDFTRSGKYRTALAVRASPGEPRPRDHYIAF